MRIAALIIAVIASLSFSACYDESEPEPQAVEPVQSPEPTPESETLKAEDEAPGLPAVYERIAGMTDCVALQEQFDIAVATNERSGGPPASWSSYSWAEIGLGYMRAANERMEEVGCYE